MRLEHTGRELVDDRGQRLLGHGVRAGRPGTWWTRSPGSTSTTGGRSGDQARVNTSQATPERASAEVSSRT